LSYAPFNNLRLSARLVFALTLHYRAVPLARRQYGCSTRSMVAVTLALEQCGNGQTPLAFCGLKSAKQLVLERPSVYEVANRGAPQIVNDKTIIPMTSVSVFWGNKLRIPWRGPLQGA